MGFQFNHVGGGTKTRRPITLHMKYNSACIQPHCFLITDEFGEQEASLEELQVRLQAWSLERAAGRRRRWGSRLGRQGMHMCPALAPAAAGRLPTALLLYTPAHLHHCSPFHACRTTSRMRMRDWTARRSSGARAGDWKRPAACRVPALDHREGWGAASSAVVLCSHVSKSACAPRLA